MVKSRKAIKKKSWKMCKESSLEDHRMILLRRERRQCRNETNS